MSTPVASHDQENESECERTTEQQLHSNNSNNNSTSDSFGHIQVACRVRPPSKKELSLSKHATTTPNCLRVDCLGNSVTVLKPNSSEEKSFQFDYCANGASTQEDVFNQVGLGITKRCMEGYNGTILCYGQTGTGKVWWRRDITLSLLYYCSYC